MMVIALATILMAKIEIKFIGHISMLRRSGATVPVARNSKEIRKIKEIHALGAKF